MKLVIAYGTRPEELKTRSIAEALADYDDVECLDWCSGQSKDMVQASDPNDTVSWSGDLAFNVSRCIHVFYRYLCREEPDAVIVQGDTATAYACALAAFLNEIPVAHVEAGLRTYARDPFPEEGFRRMIAAMATWHFAPDNQAAENLLCESGNGYGGDFRAPDSIYVVGNTIIDTLPSEPFRVLVTLHRRENWGERIGEALFQINRFAYEHDDVAVITIRHPNWVKALTTLHFNPDYNRLGFTQPIPHEALLEELQLADMVVTDSGGLQEEAAHFGVPCLVVRNQTERTALWNNGAIRLIDPDNPEELRGAMQEEYDRRRAYGDGTAGQQIAEILYRDLGGGTFNEYSVYDGEPNIEAMEAAGWQYDGEDRTAAVRYEPDDF